MSSAPSQIELVIFDLAGTVVDDGCHAPVVSMRQAFTSALGLEITEAECRAPMGKSKREHISEILMMMPAVRQRFQAVQGREPNDSDVDAVYCSFREGQLRTLALYSKPINRAKEAIQFLRSRPTATNRSIQIACTTGYSREEMDIVVSQLAVQGIRFDVTVSASDVDPHRGRPHADMCYLCAQLAGVEYPRSCIVVDDTPVGIQSGIAANMWTVAVVDTANDPVASRSFGEKHADFVVSSVAAFVDEDLVGQIEKRLKENPPQQQSLTAQMSNAMQQMLDEEEAEEEQEGMLERSSS
jgi:phosphonoacetaldehyde hydrolase